MITELAGPQWVVYDSIEEMKANSRGAYDHSMILVFDNFTATGATLDQVRTIFKASGFTVLPFNEVTNEIEKLR